MPMTIELRKTVTFGEQEITKEVRVTDIGGSLPVEELAGFIAAVLRVACDALKTEA
jgi:hypothetical protein